MFSPAGAALRGTPHHPRVLVGRPPNKLRDSLTCCSPHDSSSERGVCDDSLCLPSWQLPGTSLAAASTPPVGPLEPGYIWNPKTGCSSETVKAELYQRLSHMHLGWGLTRTGAAGVTERSGCRTVPLKPT